MSSAMSEGISDHLTGSGPTRPSLATPSAEDEVQECRSSNGSMATGAGGKVGGDAAAHDPDVMSGTFSVIAETDDCDARSSSPLSIMAPSPDGAVDALMCPPPIEVPQSPKAPRDGSRASNIAKLRKQRFDARADRRRAASSPPPKHTVIIMPSAYDAAHDAPTRSPVQTVVARRSSSMPNPRPPLMTLEPEMEAAKSSASTLDVTVSGARGAVPPLQLGALREAVPVFPWQVRPPVKANCAIAGMPGNSMSYA